MSAEIHSLPTALDVPVENVLDGAKGALLENVLVAGFDAGGELYAASSIGDKGELLRILETFKFKLMSGAYEVSIHG